MFPTPSTSWPPPPPPHGPHLLQVYDIETRMRAVTIFESMTSLVLTVADTYPVSSVWRSRVQCMSTPVRQTSSTDSTNMLQ